MRKKDTLLLILIYWYYIGIYKQYSLPEDHESIWDNIYYLWEKTKDLICFLLILKQFNFDKHKKYIVCGIIVLATCRIIWDVYAWIAGYEMASRKMIMQSLCIIAASTSLMEFYPNVRRYITQYWRQLKAHLKK